MEEAGGQQGTTCYLSLAPHIQLSAPESWKNAHAKQIALTELYLTTQSLVCRLCWDEVGNPPHIPRWVKVAKMTNCCAPTCSRSVFACSKITSIVRIHEHLKVWVCANTIPYITVQATLSCCVWCKQTHCCTCNSSSRRGQTQSCPDATNLQQYLPENTGFEGNISEGVWVCMPCYKSHLQMRHQWVQTGTYLYS